MFNFDNKGFLKPYKIIKCTENQFRDFFIYSLSNVKFIREDGELVLRVYIIY